jgi:hypothetical protein
MGRIVQEERACTAFIFLNDTRNYTSARTAASIKSSKEGELDAIRN